jgi:hypothetical protein
MVRAMEPPAEDQGPDPERRAATAASARDARLAPEDRGKHGVVHTPAPICRYVLRRSDVALRALGLPGLTDPALTIVDPAVGTGAFLASALALGARGPLVGIDRDPEAVVAAEAALGGRARLSVGDTLAALPAIDGPVLVVGNPPWIGGWAKGAAERRLSDQLLEDFRREADGAPLRERKVGVLSDAYVRFVRWALEVVRRAGSGALGLVTNGSYLDGPVHRGMRSFLRAELSTIELTDLGGSSLVARTSGERDDNLFGVRPSVAVTVGARGPSGGPATVTHARLRGSEAAKLEALEGEVAHSTLPAAAPATLFVPSGEPFPGDWLSLPELFPFHREGVQTNRDDVVVGPDRETLLGRMQAFALALKRPDLVKAEQAKSHYDPESARAAVRAALERDPAGEGWIRPLAYRPFERRAFVTLRELCHRPRPALGAAMAHGGWALLSVRKDRGERGWNHVGATRDLVDNCYFSSRSSCRTRAFPAKTPKGDPNLSAEGAARFGDRDRAAAFALAVIGAAPYRERFGDVLRRDYPRIPDAEPAAIERLVSIGQALAAAFEERGTTEIAIGHRTAQGPARLLALRADCDAAVATLLPH